MPRPLGQINVTISHHGKGWAVEWVGAEAHASIHENAAHMTNFIVTLLGQHLAALQAGALAKKGEPGASSPGT